MYYFFHSNRSYIVLSVATASLAALLFASTALAGGFPASGTQTDTMSNGAVVSSSVYGDGAPGMSISQPPSGGSMGSGGSNGGGNGGSSSAPPPPPPSIRLEARVQGDDEWRTGRVFIAPGDSVDLRATVSGALSCTVSPSGTFGSVGNGTTNTTVQPDLGPSTAEWTDVLSALNDIPQRDALLASVQTSLAQGQYLSFLEGLRFNELRQSIQDGDDQTIRSIFGSWLDRQTSAAASTGGNSITYRVSCTGDGNTSSSGSISVEVPMVQFAMVKTPIPTIVRAGNTVNVEWASTLAAPLTAVPDSTVPYPLSCSIVGATPETGRYEIELSDTPDGLFTSRPLFNTFDTVMRCDAADPSYESVRRSEVVPGVQEL